MVRPFKKLQTTSASPLITCSERRQKKRPLRRADVSLTTISIGFNAQKPEEEWNKQMRVIEASFGDYFSDDYVDDDLDE